MNENSVQEFREILNSDCKGIISEKPNFEGFSPIQNSKTDVLWPCVLYQVEVQVDNADLDIFERTVLRLAECDITRTQEVSEILCMQRETVEFIQNRLVVRGMLKERLFSLTESGKTKIDALSENQSTESKVVSLLRDLNTGLFLDFVAENPAKNTFNGAFSFKEEPLSLVARFSSPMLEKDVKGKIVVPCDLNSYKKFKEEEPETFKILRAIRKFRKIAGKKSPIHLNDKSNFADIKSKEVVLVHTRAFATRSGDIFVSDAAGLGISDIFTDFIRHADGQCYPWISKILEKGDVQSENKNPGEKQIEEKLRFEYPKPSRLFYDSVRDLQELKGIHTKENSNLRDEAKRLGEKIIYTVYTAFEYALQMHYNDFHDENAEDERLNLADCEARKLNERQISEMEGIATACFFYPLAQNLGFSVTSENLSLLRVYQGKIKAMRSGDEPELTPLLCLCLAYADSDGESPFALLAEERQDFILRLFDIKSLRDNTLMAHGPGLSATDVAYQKVEKIVGELMFAAQFLNVKLKGDFAKIGEKTKNQFPQGEQKFNSVLQSRYNAKIELCKDFGISAINSLPTNLVNQMINWNVTLRERKFVASGSCSLLQQFFENAVTVILRTSLPPEKTRRNAECACEKCRNAGFALENGTLPDSLATVNPNRIRKAVCGGGCETVGAAILAFLLLLSEVELHDIALRNKKFILDLEFLLKERGHSDIRDYSVDEASTFKKIVTCIIKEVIEYIY